MELSIDQQIARLAALKKEVEFQTQVLQSSEKYERLMENEDFQSMMKDLKDVVDAHNHEIKAAMESMSEVKLVDLDEVKHIIFLHQIMKEYVEKAISRPGELIAMAKTAAEQIPQLRDAIKNLEEEISHA